MSTQKNTEPIVRRMEEKDLQECKEINRKFIPERYSDDFWTDIFISNQDSCFVATLDDTVVGYCLARREVMNKGGRLAPVSHIISVVVDSSHRRKHLAEQMTQLALKTSKEYQCIYTYLEVRTNNYPAIGLYTKLGFTKQTIYPRYYEDGTNAYIMTRGN
jgi:[ribosomal protein S18]-alanine N-acetyltransferase